MTANRLPTFGINHPVPAFVRRRRKIVGFIYGGIIDENVDRAPRVLDLAGDVLHAVTIGYGNLETQRTASVGLDLCFDLLRQDRHGNYS